MANYPMQFSDLQARAALLASLEGWTDIAIAPAWDVLVNQAWEKFSWDGECILSSTTFSTVANQANYALSGNFKRLIDVVYLPAAGGSLPLLHSKEDWERYVRADWRVQASGQPLRYTFAPFNNLTLVPPPTTSGDTISVRGVIMGTYLSSSSASLPIPDTLNEGVCLMAAILQGYVYAQSGGAADRIKDYQARYDAYVKQALDFANFEAEGN